ncbi:MULTISPECIES: hypothetical protein [unclassified Pseudactinotalea]|uniref:vWA domain-containing protein n=1 Tax=unclassified Pseudactinotalea TaxID=2649176 RepID=UPI00128E8F10|nr:MULTISPECIES: hypothetical protein [unclassified Pseudactinotalea]MPV50590.1 hypothetical protein [Pseudactinotalea sp. HY160]QGH70747.1 hypothetical protein GCE65_15530 [Pseudactinotalea sp. HY158]
MVSQVLLQPWALAAAVALVVALGVAGWWARRPRMDDAHVTWIANAEYVPGLRSFQSQLRVYRTGMVSAAVLVVATTLAAGVVASRPVEQAVRSDELATRDIVLCLDVSGSMIGYDEEIVDRFLELLPSFHGERVALSIWNSTSRTVFPLTNDYEMVREQLEEARYVLSFDLDSFGLGMDQHKYERLLDFIQGTYLESLDSASLVGDGLASCGLLFDESDTERSRSIIFATDNDVQGEPLYTLTEATDKVSDQGVKLFGLYAGETTAYSEGLRDEFQRVFTAHGGSFYEASNPDLADDVVDQIAAQQAADLDATEKVITTDRATNAFGWLAVLLGGYLIVMWRLRS